MNLRIRTLALCALLATHAISDAHAEVLAEHVGDADPVAEEGWNEVATGSTPLTVGPDNGAWRITDDRTDGTRYYTSEEFQQPYHSRSTPWILSAQIQMLGDSDPDGSPLLYFRDGNFSFQLHFGEDSGADEFIVRRRIVGGSYIDTRHPGGGTAHQVELRFLPDDGDGVVELWVDDALVGDHPGFDLNTVSSGSGAGWGAGSTSGVGDARFYEVRLECDPPPANPRGTSTSEIIGPAGDHCFNGLWNPQAVATDKDGNVYVTGDGSFNAFKITPAGMISEIIDATGNGVAPLANPRAITADYFGNQYIAGYLSNNVFKITPGGQITEIIDYTGGGTATLQSPSALVTDSTGNVYVAGENSSNVFKITPGGQITEIIDSTGNGFVGLSSPRALATDSTGNVYVTGGFNGVFKITPALQIIEILHGGAGTGLQSPWALATDSANNVYVAGADSDTVIKISPIGVVTEIIDATGDGIVSLDTPYALAIDATDNVYVAGALSSNVFRITPTGKIDEIVNATGDGDDTLLNPFGLAIDPAGNVFVPGYSSNNVLFVPEPRFQLLTVISLAVIALLRGCRRARTRFDS